MPSFSHLPGKYLVASSGFQLLPAGSSAVTQQLLFYPFNREIRGMRHFLTSYPVGSVDYSVG